MTKKYIAEFFSTTILTLAIVGTLVTAVGVPTALMAGITLGLLVYIIGQFSYAHVNPAVTLAFLFFKKISKQEALFLILAQFAGAAVAVLLSRLTGIIPPLSGLFSWNAFIGELVGTFFFTFGIASIALKPPHVGTLNPVGKDATDLTAPFIIGGSLTVGAVIATGLGANGILNPAVAFGLGSFGLVYAIAPIIGAIFGMWAYVCLSKTSTTV